MAFAALTTTETSAGKAIIQALMRKIKSNFDWLYGTIGTMAGLNVPNASFEIDSLGTGQADSWALSAYSGGTIERETAIAAHGGACLAMTHPGGGGNGGGNAVSDYVPCSIHAPVVVQLIHWATAAGMRNIVTFNWYDKDLVACATPSTTVYSSVTNPTSSTLLLCGATPPATACYFKLVLIGGDPAVNVAGTAYWDGILLFPPRLDAYSALAIGTLAEQSTNSDAWVDAGSFVVTPRIAGLPMRLSFAAELKGPATDSQQRFYIGANYSNVAISTSSVAYQENVFTISLPASAGAPLTVVQQLVTSSGGSSTVYGRKAGSIDTINPALAI